MNGFWQRHGSSWCNKRGRKYSKSRFQIHDEVSAQRIPDPSRPLNIRICKKYQKVLKLPMVYRSSVDTCPTQSQIICIRVQGLRYSEITLQFPIFHVVTGGMFNHLCLTRTCQGGLRQSAQRGSRENTCCLVLWKLPNNPGRLTWKPENMEVWKMIFPLASCFMLGLEVFWIPQTYQASTQPHEVLEDDYVPFKFSVFRVPCQFSWMYSPWFAAEKANCLIKGDDDG